MFPERPLAFAPEFPDDSPNGFQNRVGFSERHLPAADFFFQTLDAFDQGRTAVGFAQGLIDKGLVLRAFGLGAFTESVKHFFIDPNGDAFFGMLWVKLIGT